MSSAQPRLLFAIQENDNWSIFSLPQHLSPSSLVVTPEFHKKFTPGFTPAAYASGLVYSDVCRSPKIYNPMTGRYEVLPFIGRYRKTCSFFGFDPVDKQLKVLLMAYPFGPDDHRIMTLGTTGMRWRKIKCSLTHEWLSAGICINGVLYYLGGLSHCTEKSEQTGRFVIVCFDVGSEEFNFIYLERSCGLINYKGKLGLVYYDDDLSDNAIELRVWVLEDAEKLEWSKYAYTLRDDRFFLPDVLVAGVTSTGEIVLSMFKYTPKQPFYVFYFNPERNTLQCAEIRGFGDDSSRVYVFADHVDDLNVHDSKLLRSSIYVPYVYRAESEEDDDDDYNENGLRCFYGKRKKLVKEHEDKNEE